LDTRRIRPALAASALALAGTLLGQGAATAADIPGGALAPGVSVTAAIARSTDTVSYTWAATEGRHVTFDVTASRWDTRNREAGSVSFKIFDAAGVQKKTCAIERPEHSCDVTPDSTGTWKAQLVPGMAARGTATFTLRPDPLPAA
jgi:hypothetical protein